MKIYLFDMNTKRFLKEGEAIYNPVNPANPHIPAYATKIAPPEYGACEAPYYINGKWVIKPCYIGKKAVHVASKFVETIYYEGDLKDGWQYVDNKTAKEISEIPERYTVKNNKLVRLSDEEYTLFLEHQKAEEQVNSIQLQLQSMDAQAIRPLRAILSGTQTNEDLTRLQQIEAQSVELRQQLKSFVQIAEK